jgi:hypothetical protein
MSYKAEEMLDFIEASLKLDSCWALGGPMPPLNKGGVCIPLTKANTRGWNGYFYVHWGAGGLTASASCHHDKSDMANFHIFHLMNSSINIVMTYPVTLSVKL